MADIGTLGGLTYRMSFPEPQQFVGNQPAAAQPVDVSVPQYSDDPLAEIEGLTNNYYSDLGMVRSFAYDMAKRGIDVFSPDYSQEGGGLPFRTMQKLQANLLHSANAFRNEQRAKEQLAPYLAQGLTRMNSNVDPSRELAYSDPRNFYGTRLDPATIEANRRTAENLYTTQDVNALNRAVTDPNRAALQQKYTNPEELAYQQSGTFPAVRQTPPSYFDRNNGAGSSVGAYVTEFSEIARGLGFQPGSTYDAQGNRVDVARPASFVGRPWGYTPDGKKFILDRFERSVSPEGGVKVDMVDVNGNRLPVDPNNITGSMRGFIETNEGAAALRDLNTFFQKNGLDPATQKVPASMFTTQSATDLSNQTSTAPKVQATREVLSNTLDYLSEGGIGRFLKNVVAVGTGNYGKIRGTELKYKTEDGNELIINKNDDKFTLKNYKDIYPGGVEKGGGYYYNGSNIKDMFVNLSKEKMLSLLEQLGVVNVQLKDSGGKEVTVPTTTGGVVNPGGKKLF